MDVRGELDSPEVGSAPGFWAEKRRSFALEYASRIVAATDDIGMEDRHKATLRYARDYARYIESGELPEDLAVRALVQSNISSPFVCAAGMLSYQHFLELCVTEFDLIKELTAVCAEQIHRVLDVVLANRNIDCVWMGGCEWLTPPMGSPKLYEELVQPFEAALISHVHEAGALVHVHCHGNVRSTLELVIQRGADSI